MDRFAEKCLGASLGGVLGSAPPQLKNAPPKQATAIDRVDEAFMNAHRLVTRIEDLRDRLLGARPCGDGCSESSIAEGVLPNLEHRALTLDVRLASAIGAVDEIGQALA